jgi:hypothetical protein
MDIHTIQQILQDHVNANITTIILKYTDPSYYYASKEYYYRCLDYIAQHQETISKQLSYSSPSVQKKYASQDTDTSFEYIVKKAHRLYYTIPHYAFYPGFHIIADCKRCACSDTYESQHMCSDNDDAWFFDADEKCSQCNYRKGFGVELDIDRLKSTNLDTNMHPLIDLYDQEMPKSGGLIHCLMCEEHAHYEDSIYDNEVL